MNKEDFLKSGLLEQYLLNLTEPEETEQVERMLRRYPEIKKELDAMHNAIEQYALSHSIPPPHHLKDEVLAKIGKSEHHPDGKASSPSASLPWRSLSGPIVVLALSLLSLMLWLQTRGLNEDYSALRKSMLAQQQACEEQLKQAQSRPYAFLSLPSTQTVILKGTPLTPEAEAVVYWNPIEKTACLNVLNLPEPPADQQYQIWADVDGEMINMGLIHLTKEAMQTVHFIAKAESFNITLEPQGGSEHPTVSLLQANGRVL